MLDGRSWYPSTRDPQFAQSRYNEAVDEWLGGGPLRCLERAIQWEPFVDTSSPHIKKETFYQGYRALFANPGRVGARLPTFRTQREANQGYTQVFGKAVTLIGRSVNDFSESTMNKIEGVLIRERLIRHFVHHEPLRQRWLSFGVRKELWETAKHELYD